MGMNREHKMLFENKSWSTEKVFKETVHDLKKEGLSFATLEELIDIDEPGNIPPSINELLKNPEQE